MEKNKSNFDVQRLRAYFSSQRFPYPDLGLYKVMIMKKRDVNEQADDESPWLLRGRGNIQAI